MSQTALYSSGCKLRHLEAVSPVTLGVSALSEVPELCFSSFEGENKTLCLSCTILSYEGRGVASFRVDFQTCMRLIGMLHLKESRAVTGPVPSARPRCGGHII